MKCPFLLSMTYRPSQLISTTFSFRMSINPMRPLRIANLEVHNSLLPFHQNDNPVCGTERKLLSSSSGHELMIHRILSHHIQLPVIVGTDHNQTNLPLLVKQLDAAARLTPANRAVHRAASGHVTGLGRSSALSFSLVQACHKLTSSGAISLITPSYTHTHSVRTARTRTKKKQQQQQRISHLVPALVSRPPVPWLTVNCPAPLPPDYF
ncbi:hypothetical protein B0H66DRAFT_115706 [Apodospora peruviana]|uniref:Uncharacterized protein n=1 Tax=Apodospora peruviana TaxID=516989 RepID=A0AAE0MAD7_9PEZI|nr:hypothetical protein B0H66DRAFT_115706 [Apodospora peruviana]